MKVHLPKNEYFFLYKHVPGNCDSSNNKGCFKKKHAIKHDLIIVINDSFESTVGPKF